MRGDQSWWSLFTVDYIRPLLDVSYNKPYEKVEFESLGQLPENLNFEKTVPLLEAAYAEEQKKRPESNKALVLALA